MTARAFGALTLAVSMGLASPWLTAPAPTPTAETPASAGPRVSAAPAVYPEGRLHAAVEAAARRQVPGAGSGEWRLDRIDVSDADDSGVQHVVATGVIAAAGDAGTRVRLSGRYDAASGALKRVSYRLLPAMRALPEPGAGTPGWTLQDAVQDSLAKAHPGSDVRFALDSAQASRLERGGRRFEGFGLAVMDGDARFVAFTLDLSAQGQSLAFDFGPEALAARVGPELAAAPISDRD